MELLAELSQFSWREANWLWGLGFPLVWWLYQAWSLRRQQTDYAQAEFWPWVLSQKSAQRKFNLLASLAWVALILALAGPRIEQTDVIESDRAGVDLLVVMDASRSMSAQDQKPNRFAFSQTLIESVSQQLNAQDRIGLINYTAQAHWVTPFTQDKSLFKRALYLTEPNLLPLAGSQLIDSLSFAVQQAARQTIAPLVVLLVTDGGGLDEVLDSSQLSDLRNQLAQQDAELILLAVGKTQTVWLADEQHPSGWLHDDNQPVDVALPRAALQNLSQQLNADYLEASGEAALLEKLLDPIRAKAEPLPVNQTKTEQSDLAPWLMGLALGLFMIILHLPKPGFKRLLPGLSMLGLGLFSLMSITPNTVWAASTSLEHQAYQAFEAQEFEQAERLYTRWLETTQVEQPDQMFRALIGAGNAAYRQTQYARALTWYRQAVLNARQDQARAQALFNLGNAYAQLEIWGLAVESFEAVSLYQTEHVKAQQNLTLALAALTEQQAKAAEQAAAELAAKQQGLRKDLDGSLHGGSQPNPNNEAGSGAEGESDDGRSEGTGFSLPERLADSELLTGQDWALAGSAKFVEAQLQTQRRLDNLQMELKNLQDNQQALLKHLFEREVGFQARQEKAHAIPGVQPW
ncbi:MAG: VWA domain-containing protein [Thiomicrospira sp.]|uniref:vWA domain-containing protein n=1 Tax=Thiomicrospira sp. TaxID=935 RepID=UPI0019F456E5|nr:VWA domain-containing protein [Thiomicrospira sp.]MBE0493539.1 VWA domain-containing protein [Thiomicrospira sp.]